MTDKGDREEVIDSIVQADTRKRPLGKGHGRDQEEGDFQVHHCRLIIPENRGRPAPTQQKRNFDKKSFLKWGKAQEADQHLQTWYGPGV